MHFRNLSLLSFFLFLEFNGYSQLSNDRKLDSSSNLNKSSYNQNERDRLSSIINRNTGRKTNTYVVVYNFETKVYDTNFVHPRINHPVTFKISNINRFAYDVSISSRDSILIVSDLLDESDIKKIQPETSISDNELSTSATIPKMIDTDFIEKDDKKKKESKESFVGLQRKLQLESRGSLLEKEKLIQMEKLSNLNTDSLYLLNSIKAIQAQLNQNVSDLVLSTSLSIKQDSLKIVQLKLDEIRRQIKRDNEEFNSIAVQLDSISIVNTAIDVYTNKLIGLQSLYTDVVYSYRKLWEVFRKFNQLTSISTQPLMSVAEFRKSCRDSTLSIDEVVVTSYRQYISSFYTNLNNFYRQYEQVINDYEIVRILSDDGIAKMQAPIKASKAFVDKMSNSIKERNPTEIIGKMIHVLRTMTKEEAYEIVSAPIQPSQDLVIFDIRISHKTTKEYKDDRSFSYREYVRGGLRSDLSTGIVFGFGVSDYSYRTEPSGTNDSIHIIKNKKTNQYMPSIAAMYHMSIRTWRLVSFGFTLGASISTSEFDINSLFPGISLMIGKKEKVIFTAGPAFKKINYLDSRYLIGKRYPGIEFSSTIPVNSTFRIGGFLGISYNLTKKQKSNFRLTDDSQ